MPDSNQILSSINDQNFTFLPVVGEAILNKNQKYNKVTKSKLDRSKMQMTLKNAKNDEPDKIGAEIDVQQH